MSDAEQQTTHGSTQLFAVFLVSIITLVIVPYTAYLLFGDADEDKTVRGARGDP
jgi:hypothetical protein